MKKSDTKVNGDSVEKYSLRATIRGLDFKIGVIILTLGKDLILLDFHSCICHIYTASSAFRHCQVDMDSVTVKITVILVLLVLSRIQIISNYTYIMLKIKCCDEVHSLRKPGCRTHVLIWLDEVDRKACSGEIVVRLKSETMRGKE